MLWRSGASKPFLGETPEEGKVEQLTSNTIQYKGVKEVVVRGGDTYVVYLGCPPHFGLSIYAIVCASGGVNPTFSHHQLFEKVVYKY